MPRAFGHAVMEREDEPSGSKGGDTETGVSIDFLIVAILRTNAFGERKPCRSAAPSD